MEHARKKDERKARRCTRIKYRATKILHLLGHEQGIVGAILDMAGHWH